MVTPPDQKPLFGPQTGVHVCNDTALHKIIPGVFLFFFFFFRGFRNRLVL